jgi:uncharacterized membrane protein YgaE (UPF0421/DUF939 family)
MNTNTLELRALRVSDTLAALTAPLLALAGLFRAPAPSTADSAADLMRLADAYESTQPSYAADLRAAADAAYRQ